MAFQIYTSLSFRMTCVTVLSSNYQEVRLSFMITDFIVTAGEARKRLDVFLFNRERDISRSNLQRLIALGRVRLNAQVAKPSQKIKPGDSITMDTPQPGPQIVNGIQVALEILYEDDVLLVVNKPAGVVVHPTSGNWTGTLLNALLAHWKTADLTGPKKERPQTPGLVHRLDKDTSGVMVIAKTDQAHRTLGTQFEQHTITRTYDALVWSAPEKGDDVIELPIGRDWHNSKIVSGDSSNPKHAVTTYQVIKRFGDVAGYVQLFPRTGRPHQLRAHVGSLGCPILGDTTYGGQKVREINGLEIPRVMLHARILGFQHPVSGHYQEHAANLPPDMQEICNTLGKYCRFH